MPPLGVAAALIVVLLAVCDALAPREGVRSPRRSTT
jgi:hypothetical protein